MSWKSQWSKYQRAFVLSIIGLFILVSYSNCGAPGTSGGLSSIGSGSSDTLASSLDSSSGGLALKIAQDPVFVQEGDIGFNIGGFCELGEFTISEIVWQVDNINGGAVISPNVVANACRGKRFSLTVILPSGYNFSSQHTVTVSLRAKDEQGQVAASIDSQVNVTTL